MATEPDFWDVVSGIREADDRFRPEAYGFLMEALSRTSRRLPEERRRDEATRHLSGQELLEGMTRVAREEFGELAPLVFREWGVTRSEDVGDMVFHLVRANQLRARPEDSREDFRGFDLERRLASTASSSGA